MANVHRINVVCSVTTQALRYALPPPLPQSQTQKCTCNCPLIHTTDIWPTFISVLEGQVIFASHNIPDPSSPRPAHLKALPRELSTTQQSSSSVGLCLLDVCYRTTQQAKENEEEDGKTHFSYPRLTYSQMAQWHVEGPTNSLTWLSIELGYAP